MNRLKRQGLRAAAAWGAGLALLPLCGAVAAQGDGATRHIVVVSLIADQLEIVTPVDPVSTRLDRQSRQTVPLKDSTLDRAFAAHLGRQLPRLLPQAKVTALVPLGPDAYADQGRWLRDDKLVPPDWLKKDLAAEQATQMLLLLKHRDQVSMKFSNATLGNDMQIEGLGYYLDGRQTTGSGDDPQRAKGFIAPYAYFRMLLVDLNSWRVLRRVDVTGSQPISAVNNKEGTDPWGALSQAEKIQRLALLVARESEARLPELLQSP